MYHILFICFFCMCLISNVLNDKWKIKLLKYKKISLGSLNVKELNLLEWKPLFSLKLFYFEKGEAQEIYHTHSFESYSLLLYGNYMEAMYDKEKGFWSEPRNRSRIIYIPKDRFHQITKSEGCVTLMLTGPWGDTYKEYNDKTNEIIISTHGRRELERVKHF